LASSLIASTVGAFSSASYFNSFSASSWAASASAASDPGYSA
jgi:hypothetical protein